MRRFGFGRGALSKAAEQAIEAWLNTASESSRFEGDPVRAIQGILHELNAGSVELQHTTQRIWAGKASHDVSG